MRKIYFGKVKFGRFYPDNLDDFKEGLKSLEGKEVEFTIGTIKKRRSLQQNKYYWSVVVPIIAKELGYNKEQAHEALMWHFLKIDDGKIPTIKRTSELTTVEWEEYMRDVRVWASEFLNCFIPLPNEVEI